MIVSSRTLEGEPHDCPVCGKSVCVEPSRPPADAPCPACGTLLWFGPRRFMTAWDYGMMLLEIRNVEKGLQVLQRCVTHQPDDVRHRRRLRTLEQQVRSEHLAGDESGVLELSDAWREIHLTKRKRSTRFIEWDAVEIAAERGLAIDPWDVDLHIELGHALRMRGYVEAARFAFGCARELAPDRPEIQDWLAALPDAE